MSLLLLGVSRPEFSGVIDLVGVAAEAAYGVRKLRGAYAGSCVRIRRDSDNAESDFGFDPSGDLDMVAVLAFCGADNGYIVTWYDQSGNSRDVAQATAGNQPKLRGTGFVIPGEESPWAIFNGTTQFVTRVGTALTGLFANSVHHPAAVATIQTIIRHNATISGTLWYLRLESAATAFLRTPTSASGGTTTAAAQVSSATSNNGANSEIFRNGTSIATAVSMGSGATNGTMNIGVSPSGGQYYGGNIAEVIVFSSDLTTTQRQTLERNQGTYYGITVA